MQIDEGCVRLGAANALLKLARGHNSPVTADVYLQLALTMQVQHSQMYACDNDVMLLLPQLLSKDSRADVYLQLAHTMQVQPSQLHTCDTS